MNITTYVYLYIHIHTYIHTYIYIYIYIHMCVSIYMYTYIYICIRVTKIYVRVCVGVCVCVCVCAHLSVYLCIQIYVYITKKKIRWPSLALLSHCWYFCPFIHATGNQCDHLCTSNYNGHDPVCNYDQSTDRHHFYIHNNGNQWQ
jgi:hypothetical protein